MFAGSSFPPCIKVLAHWLSWLGAGLWTGVHPPTLCLPPSKIKHTFLSINLAFLLVFEWWAAGPQFISGHAGRLQSVFEKVGTLNSARQFYIPALAFTKYDLNQWTSEVAQSCPTLCDPMDCSLPVSSICGIFQPRVLEWVAISFSKDSSWPRDWTQVSQITGRRFTIWAFREAQVWFGGS